MPLLVWAYLIHHQVVVALVPITILQRGEKPRKAQSGVGEAGPSSGLCPTGPQPAQRSHFPLHITAGGPTPCPAGSDSTLWLRALPQGSSLSLLLFAGLHPFCTQGRHGAPRPPPGPHPISGGHPLCCTHVMPRKVLLLPLPLQVRASRLLLILRALGRGSGDALSRRGRRKACELGGADSLQSPASCLCSLEETSQCCWLPPASVQHPAIRASCATAGFGGQGSPSPTKQPSGLKEEALLSPSAQRPAASPYWHPAHPALESSKMQIHLAAETGFSLAL